MTIQNKYYTIESLNAFKNQIGAYSFVRWMRNKGVSFSTAYFILFQKSPTF